MKNSRVEEVATFQFFIQPATRNKVVRKSHFRLPKSKFYPSASKFLLFALDCFIKLILLEASKCMFYSHSFSIRRVVTTELQKKKIQANYHCTPKERLFPYFLYSTLYQHRYFAFRDGKGNSVWHLSWYYKLFQVVALFFLCWFIYRKNGFQLLSESSRWVDLRQI